MKNLTIGRYYSMTFASIYWKILSKQHKSLKLAIYYKDNNMLAEKPRWYKNINYDIVDLWEPYKQKE